MIARASLLLVWLPFLLQDEDPFYRGKFLDALKEAEKQGKVVMVAYEGESELVPWKDPRVREWLSKNALILHRKTKGSPVIVFYGSDRHEYDRIRPNKPGVETLTVEQFLISVRGALAAREQKRKREERRKNRKPAEPSAFGTGIYGMDALIDFDVLDAVTIDPESGALTLTGHRRDPDRLMSINYMDHLATALESNDPDMTLDETAETRAIVDRVRTMAQPEIAAFFWRAAHLTDWGLFRPAKERPKKLWGIRQWLMFEAGFPVGARRPIIGVKIGPNRAGLLVLEALPISPGGRAGLKTGDIILDANGTPMFAPVTLVRAIQEGGVKPIPMTVRRGEEMLDLVVTPRVYQDLPSMNAYDILAMVLEASGDEEGAGLLRLMGRGRFTALVELLEVEGIGPEALTKLAQRFQLDPAASLQKFAELSGNQPGEAAFAGACETLTRAAVTGINETFRSLLRKKPYYHIPWPYIRQFIKGGTETMARFRGMPVDSLMARVSLEADLALKGLPYNQTLEARVPGYRTILEVLNTSEHDVTGHTGHMYIKPDPFSVAVSEEGRTIRFLKTPMRIHMRRYADGWKGEQSVAEDLLSEYAQVLTDGYDELSRIFPAFHELKECMKMLTLAKWLKEQGFKVELPKKGRIRWETPEVIEQGLVNASMTFQEGAKWPLVFGWEGGVVLRVPPVEFQRRQGPLVSDEWKVPVFQRTDEAARKLMRDMPKVPELPKPDGWITKAKVGDRAEQQVTILASHASQASDPVRAHQLAEQLEDRAKMISYYDRINNAMTKDRVKTMRDLATIRTQAQNEMKKMGNQAVETLTSGIASLDDFAYLVENHPEVSKYKQVVDRITSVRDAANEMKQGMGAWKRGELRQEAMRKLSDEIRSKTRELAEEVLKLKAKDPRFANHVLKRAASWEKSVKGLVGMTNKTLAVKEMHDVVKQLDTNMEDQAKYMNQFKPRYEKAVQRYLKTREELGQALEGR